MATPVSRAVEAEFQRGLKLQKDKKSGEAELAYANLLAVDSTHANAHHNLGLLKLNAGHPALALPYLLYSVHLNAESAEAHNTLGNAWNRLAKSEEAEAAFRRAVELKPNFALAWFNLGNLMVARRRGEDAEKAFRSAIAAKPDYPEAYLNLSNLLRAQERRQDALKMLKKLVEIAPKYDLAHNNLGNLYRDLDNPKEAAASYRRSLEINPHYALAWLNLASTLNQLGRREDSVAALRRAISVAPRFGEPYLQLAATIPLALDDPAVSAMALYFDEPGVASRDKMHLAFGLGRVLDQHGQYEKAFRYWSEGNRIRRGTLSFDIASEKRLVQRIKAQFSGDFLATAPAPRVVDQVPIFIVGMVRSGMGLMGQILTSHPQVAGGGEMSWIPQIASAFKPASRRAFPESIASATADDLTRMAADYLGRMGERYGTDLGFAVDRLPGNFLYIGLVHMMLPGAKIIHMQRDARDTGLSIYGTLFANFQAYGYDLKEIGDFHGLYREMMDHWDAVMPGKILHQRYEDLVTSPEESIRKVLDYCGLPFDASCLDYHKARSADGRVSRPAVDPLHPRSVGRWRPYEAQLGALLESLGDVA